MFENVKKLCMCEQTVMSDEKGETKEGTKKTSNG